MIIISGQTDDRFGPIESERSDRDLGARSRSDVGIVKPLSNDLTAPIYRRTYSACFNSTLKIAARTKENQSLASSSAAAEPIGQTMTRATEEKPFCPHLETSKVTEEGVQINKDQGDDTEQLDHVAAILGSASR